MAEIQEFLSKKAEEQINKYEKTINNLVVVYSKLSGEAQKLDAKQKEQVNTQKELDNQTKAYNNLLSQLNATSGKLQVAESGLNKELIRQKEELRQANREIKASNDLYQQANLRLEKLRNTARNAALSHGLMSKEAKTARADYLKLNNEINSINRSLGNHTDNVGNYSSALSGATRLLGALGFAGALFTAINLIKDGIKASREFQKETAVLAGVLGKTTAETKELSDNAKLLGATTEKTASEVLNLQTAYARLGFSQKEILNLTKDTINGSTALNAQLDETAELTGAVIRTFDNFDTTDAGLVLDQLTLSTQKSALNFEKLQTAIPIVAGAANTAGISFTRLLALLGKLSDSGIDASSSATALRNIFIESAAQGKNYEQILNEIVESQDKLTAANDEFGKRASVSATILSKNIRETILLDNALQGAGGTAEKVARQQLDTLDGKVKILNSAWEGLVLNVFDSEGAFGDLSEATVELLTSILNLINSLFNTSKELTNVDLAVDELIKTFGSEENILKDSNKAREQLIINLQNEGISYQEAKKQADEYLKTLEFINSELGKNIGKNIEIALLKNEIELLEKSGGRIDVIQSKKEKLRNLEDEMRYSKIKLNEATDEELNNYLKLQDSFLKLSDYAENFLDKVRAEIELRKQNVETLKEEKKQWEDLTKIQTKTTDIKVENSKKEKEKRNENIVSAEEGAYKLFETENKIRRDKIEREQEAAVAKMMLEQLMKENSINAAYDIATIGINLLGEQTAVGKIAAISQATISGYLGAQKAFTETPGPIPIKFLAAAAAGSFAFRNIQKITATDDNVPKIPAFAEGTESTPSGTWLAGEEGRELKVDKYGNMQLISTPTLFNNEAGSKIFSNPDTERILRGDMPNKRSLDTEKIVGAIRENRSQMNVMLDKYGIINISRNGRNRTKILNSKFRNKA